MAFISNLSTGQWHLALHSGWYCVPESKMKSEVPSYGRSFWLSTSNIIKLDIKIIRRAFNFHKPFSWDY